MIKVKNIVSFAPHMPSLTEVWATFVNPNNPRKFVGPDFGGKLLINFSDELDIMDWALKSTPQNHPIDYKVDLEITNHYGNKYKLVGCFPISLINNSVMVSYDLARKL